LLRITTGAKDTKDTKERIDMWAKLVQVVLFASAFTLYGIVGTSDYNDAVVYDEYRAWQMETVNRLLEDIGK